jgi:hypothetical protein
VQVQQVLTELIGIGREMRAVRAGLAFGHQGLLSDRRSLQRLRPALTPQGRRSTLPATFRGRGGQRIVALETLRPSVQPNLLLLRLHADDGAAGLGEAFFGAAVVEAIREAAGSGWTVARRVTRR